MTRVVGTPLRGIDFSSPSDEAVSARTSGDSYPRIRIDAGGRITLGTGAIPGDTKLYRSDTNTLFTDGIFSASGGLITLTTSGSPTVEMPDGALAIDVSNNAFYFRASGIWTQVTSGEGGGSATIEVSDTPPIGATQGDLWFDSTSATTYIYYDSFWVDINGTQNITPAINDLSDVNVDLSLDGDILTYSSATSEWENIPFPTANPVTPTSLTSSVSTAIGQFATNTFDSGEFFVEMKQGTKRLATKIIVTHNFESTASAQFGTAEIGTPGIPASFSASIDSGYVKLFASVLDAGSSSVYVRTTKTLIRDV